MPFCFWVNQTIDAFATREYSALHGHVIFQNTKKKKKECSLIGKEKKKTEKKKKVLLHYVW